MALDLNNLPPEQSEPDKPPSKFVWTVIFFVLIIAGIFAVLTFWPRDEPARTPLFWVCVALFPTAAAAFLVSRPFSIYERHCLDVRAWNAACKDHKDGLFARESIPMYVLGTAARVTEDRTAELVERIENKSLSLDAQASAFDEHASIRARWLEPDDALLAADDEERHDLLLKWLFDSLVEDLKDRIRSLPDDFPLRVVLDVSGYLGAADAQAVWTTTWARHGLRWHEVTIAPVPIDLMTIDRWLDDSDGPLHRYAVLLISVSLQGLLDQRPSLGAAEAGLGLLLCSQSLAEQHRLSPIAEVHRPLSSASGNLDHTLTYALRWANTGAPLLEAVWMTGIDGESAGPVHSSLAYIGVRTKDEESLTEFDLDRTAGHAGYSAGWLALACSVDRANRAGAPQLVVQRVGEHTFAAVVRPAGRNELKKKETLHDSEIQA